MSLNELFAQCRVWCWYAFGWLVFKEVLFAFNCDLKLKSFLSWCIGPSAFFAALKITGVWDMRGYADGRFQSLGRCGFFSSWDATKEVLFWPVVITALLLWTGAIDRVMRWRAAGCPPREDNPSDEAFHLWLTAEAAGRTHLAVEIKASGSTVAQRIRMYQGLTAALGAFAGLLCLANALSGTPDGEAATLLRYTFGGLCALTVGSLLLKPKSWWLESEVEAARMEFLRALRRWRWEANRRYVATVASLTRGILPGFWDALEVLTVIVIVRYTWLYGPAAHRPIVDEILVWGYVFLGTFILFERFQYALHSTNCYAKLVTHFRLGKYGRSAPPPRPFGKSAPAETHELGGLL